MELLNTDISGFLGGLLHAQVRAEFLRVVAINGGSLPTSALVFTARRATERVLESFPEPVRSRIAVNVDAMARDIVENVPVPKPGEVDRED